jgi:hypothetical protein
VKASGMRARVRPRPAEPEPETQHTAEAWIDIYRARADRTEQVEIPEDASDVEIRRLWRGAAMRASEIPVRVARRGTLA